MTLTERLKNEIRNSEKTLTQIAEESGVSQPALSRFISETKENSRDIRLETADKLAAYFGLELIRPKQSKEQEKKESRERERKLALIIQSLSGTVSEKAEELLKMIR